MRRQRGVEYEVGDVVWTVDPFKLGKDVSRMFAIISTDSHPFENPQFVGVAITTTSHLISHPLHDRYWDVGGTPEESYILPLSIHSPKFSNIQAPPNYDAITDPWQGRLKRDFIRKVIGEVTYTLSTESQY